jgi:hypothetical protein
MSGFLPSDLARWALGGGAGNNAEEEEVAQDAPRPSADHHPQQLSEDDIRSRRLARMNALQQPGPMEVDTETVQAMDVDVEPPQDRKPPAKPAAAHAPSDQKPLSPSVASPLNQSAEPMQKKNKKSKEESNRKLEKKKELLLKKVLSLSLAGSSTTSDSSCAIVGGVDEISVQTIADILSSRLAMTKFPDSHPKGLLRYLAGSHKKAGEELKTCKQLPKGKQVPELEEILQEIQSQTVSYAASSLMIPDLFEGGRDGTIQLAKSLLAASTDLTSSITHGVTGTQSSFYYTLCEELLEQDKALFESIIASVVNYLTTALAKVDTVLDSGSDGGGLVIVSAMAALCSHKKAAHVMTQLPDFLLPPASSPVASIRVTPQAPTLPPGASAQQQQFFHLMQAMGRPNMTGYLKRSGPALEKDTILGRVLRLGCPRDSPSVTSAFPIVMASVDSIEKASAHQRRQLVVYQDTCNQLVRALVTAGADARNQVMTWVVDALTVNSGATAMRPDYNRVSKAPTLINLSAVLLKLCEPFMMNGSKVALIDPGFVSAAEVHGEVYTTNGDGAVSRLGENPEPLQEYNPKNSFIPQCFFFAARSLHLGFVPLSSFHHNLLRQINHLHYDLRQRNADIASDPRFSNLISMQRANEVTLFLEEMVSSTLRFCNLMASFLLSLNDDQLRTMPEHFVDDICDILMFVAKMKPKYLLGHELHDIFRMVVKLLSPTYATLVRNYNLRAKLGDVLYEVYLPSDIDGRRDVPSSVASDPLAGGQTFLLSDKVAQETLAPSLLLLYGEVEHTGYYEKMGHRANIASLLKFLWESTEHRPAFRRITQNKDSFIKFANGIMNETNALIASVMEKLPQVRLAQEQMDNPQVWAALPEEQRETISSRLEDNEHEVKRAFPLCSKTLQMLGYLNTDKDIRSLFLLQEMCPRLVNMLLHVLTKLVGSKGLELKVRRC